MACTVVWKSILLCFLNLATSAQRQPGQCDCELIIHLLAAEPYSTFEYTMIVCSVSMDSCL